jgi:hypothetical protein
VIVSQVSQWLLEDDFSMMSVIKERKNSVSNAQKLNQHQAEHLEDAMDFNLDEEGFIGYQHGFSDHDKHLKACTFVFGIFSFALY